MSIYLTAIIKSKQGYADALKPFLQELVNQSKKEAACLQYDLHQVEDNPKYIFFMKNGRMPQGFSYIIVSPTSKTFSLPRQNSAREIS